MADHYWGDKDFDWELLHKAMIFIKDSMKDKAGKDVYMKEKYGSIRYENSFLWIEDDNDLKRFEEILYSAVLEFPTLGEEILEDWMAQYNDVPWFAESVYEKNPWRKSE